MQEDLALYEQRAADPRFVLDDVPRITFVKETRLRFPRAPGDYVVYCEATPEADKDNNAIWASSRAFYPVRTKKPATLGAEVVEMGPNFAKSIDRQLQVIEARLADPLLDEDERQALEREQRILTEQRRHVAAKETQDLPAATKVRSDRRRICWPNWSGSRGSCRRRSTRADARRQTNRVSA